MDEWQKRYEALVLQLQNAEGRGIYPLGHLTEEQRQAFKGTDAYKAGWDDGLIADAAGYRKVVSQAEGDIDEDRTMLLASGYCFLEEDGSISLNMNDTWAWALSWCPKVPKEQLKEVARLFRAYGNAGLMYWHSCQEKNMRSEFSDNNRAIDFVRHEEEIIKEGLSSTDTAYKKVVYTLGKD